MDKLISNSYFDKINSNLLGYIISFLDHKDVIQSSLINKKFKKALNSENLWESMILQNELFVQYDKDSFRSWKKLYFFLYKLKSNITGGKPNIGFRMKPMRGHKEIVTSMVIYEKSSFEHFVISGDKNGSVLYWIKNEEDDYEPKEIMKSESDSEIVNLKIIKLSENDFYYYCGNLKLNQNDKNLLIVTSKISTTGKNYFILNINK